MCKQHHRPSALLRQAPQATPGLSPAADLDAQTTKNQPNAGIWPPRPSFLRRRDPRRDQQVKCVVAAGRVGVGCKPQLPSPRNPKLREIQSPSSPVFSSDLAPQLCTPSTHRDPSLSFWRPSVPSLTGSHHSVPLLPSSRFMAPQLPSHHPRSIAALQLSRHLPLRSTPPSQRSLPAPQRHRARSRGQLSRSGQLGAPPSCGSCAREFSTPETRKLFSHYLI